MRSNTCRVMIQDFKNSEEVRDFTYVTLVQGDSNIIRRMSAEKDNRSHLKPVHMKGTVGYETNRNVRILALSDNLFHDTDSQDSNSRVL